MQRAFELFDAAGYDVVWGILESDLHGVPQTRTRLYYVAIKRGLGIVCDLPARIASLRGGQRAKLSDCWGEGFHFVYPHSRDKKGHDGKAQEVHHNDRALRTLRASASSLPPAAAAYGRPVLDAGPFTRSTILTAGDLLHAAGLPPLLIVPHRRRELFQVIANAVVPMSAQIALSSIGFPAAPTVSEDSKDHLSCSCTIESWEPCVLSLRRLGQAARGITHTIGVTTDTYWSSFDFGDFCRAALSGRRQARSTLRGHRIILMAVGWTPAQVAEAVEACEALFPVEATKLPAVEGAAAVLIVPEARYLRASAMRGGASGIRLRAARHFLWTCQHGSVSEEVDAWLYAPRAAVPRESVASMAGVRRALRAQLSRSLASGERIDNLRVAVEEAARVPPHFGVVPDCSTAQSVASADPYFDIEKEYDDAEPVCICGICDDIAVEAGAALPRRRAETEPGVSAHTEAQTKEAEGIYKGACDLDPYAIDVLHLEHCELCQAAVAQRAEEERAKGRDHPHPKVHRKVLHSAACYMRLFFVRAFFGFLWVCAGWADGNVRSMKLEHRWPEGPLPDLDPRRGRRPPYVHHESVFADEKHRQAYVRGMKKWYAVRGMVVPLEGVPPEPELHPQWRPPWVIPQKVVLKAKDLYKEALTKDPAKARCVCALNINHNDYFRSTRFRYTAVEYFADQLEVGDYISLVDISSFYLRLPFARRMLRYFAFADAFPDGRPKWGVHSRLPFGASLSPFYSPIVSAEALDILRGRGRAAYRRYRKLSRRLKARLSAREREFALWGKECKGCAYVDDIALGGTTKAQTAAAVRELVQILLRMGLPAVDKDLTWEPKQRQKFLGIWFDTRKEHPASSDDFVIELSIDVEYKEYLQAQVAAALADEELEEMPVPSLVGCLGWAATVMVGGSAYLCALREFEALQKKVRRSTAGWNFAARRNAKKRIAELLPEVRSDLRWWAAKLVDDSWSGSRVLTKQLATPIAIKSDASGEFGAGFHQLDVEDPVWACWPWSAEQRLLYKDDMVAKELDPLVQAVRCHGAKWRGKLLNVATDSTGVVYAINAGRAKSHSARQLMRDVADLLQEYDIDIAAQWVPRELNVVADLLSRQLTLEQALEQSGVVIAKFAATGDYEAALMAAVPSALAGA